MQRRDFLKSGLAAGVLSLTSLSCRQQLAGNERGTAGPLRLNSNENPLGISSAARQAILEELREANRYPFALAEELTAQIAHHHGILPEQVVLGNGSSEVIQMAVQALAPADVRVVLADPTFEAVENYLSGFPVEIVKVPLRADFAHDLEGMRKQAEAAPGRCLIYVCNPNNPTGSLTPVEELKAWIKEASEKHYFLVDEAYYHYVSHPGYASLVEMAVRRPNLLVTRTFSKVYGLAGLRLGYAVAQEETAAHVRRYASDANTNRLALAAARASLQDQAFVQKSLAINEEGKRLLYSVLEELEIDHIASYTSFVMYQIRGELKTYIEAMKEAGILVGRPFPPLLAYNRVSIGLPEEMERFAETLKKFRRRQLV